MTIRKSEPKRARGGHRTASALAITAISFGSIFAAGAAHAQPTGCSANAISLTQATNRSMTSSTSSTCQTELSRTIVAEIKWDKNAAPDPLVAKNSSTWTGKSRSVQVTSCDNGNTRSYYGRGYFTTSTTYYDTTPRHLTACT